jgi:WD40 repeat protein
MESRSSPYQGLVPYSEADSDFFFGRNKERQTICFNLRGSRLTILYGPTGVGKSSVLRAGVSIDLQKLAKDNLEHQGTAESIVVVFSAWRDDPSRALTKEIRDSVERIIPNAGLSEPKESGLTAAIQSYADQLDCDFLIILDQFEEYFVYQPASSSNSFAEEFLRTIKTADLRANFLISVRDDALARLDIFKNRIPKLFDNTLRIEHLRKKAAQEAIKRPLDVYNEMYGLTPPYSVEPDLIEAVCNEVASDNLPAPSRSKGVAQTDDWLNENTPIEAPLLQLVMTRIWEEENRQKSRKLRKETLTTLGEARTIVRNQLETEMNDLLEEDKDLAAEMFHYLVTPTGYKIALTLDDLAGYTNQPPEILAPVVHRLTSAGSRILRSVSASPATDLAARYEIFHDVMAPAVLEWVSAFRQEQKDREGRLRLQDEARRNQQKFEEAARKNRIKRNLLLGAFALIVILIGLFFMLVTMYFRTRKAEAAAITERTKAQNEVNYRNELEKTIPYFESILRGHSKSINKALLSPNGKIAATASEDDTVRLWDALSGETISVLGHESPVVDIAFSKSGKLLASAAGNYVIIWDTASPKELQHLNLGPVRVRKVTFSPGEDLLVASTDSPVVRVLDVATGTTRYELRGHTGPITDAQFSRDGRLLVTTSVDNTARIWSMQTGQLVSKLEGHERPVNSASFSANGNQVVTASDDGTVRLWSSLGGRTLWIMLGHAGPVHSVEFSSLGWLAVSASADHTARIWDCENRQLVKILRGHSDDVVSAEFSADGRRILTASNDRTARIWDSTGKALQDLRAHIRAVKSASFGGDGKHAITGSADTYARVWSVSEEGLLTVTEAKVSVNPSDYSGPCPGYLKIFGRISVQGVSGEVKYRFVRVVGGGSQPGVERTLLFDTPGTKEVGSVQQFGGPNFPSVGGSFYLEILSPNILKSETADFKIKCDAPTTETPKPTPKLK